MIIRVVPHENAWAEEFQKEAGLFRAILGGELLRVYHIGSTAVPDLKAKPVIDLMPVVKDVNAVDRFKADFESAG